ncbi:MAG: prepilin-type N-terminal cleavage/methylation domain-containing protein [Desulfurellaceae bacterium]|nr:prepilin-type N-terminal cleavage/methylation domain-containing protein [Desulfurellaceae bacterium]
MSKKNNKGFTLIEILVVVAIIAILAVIAIPQYMRYSKKAYDAAALSDLKRIQTEAEAYYSDYSCYPH